MQRGGGVKSGKRRLEKQNFSLDHRTKKKMWRRLRRGKASCPEETMALVDLSVQSEFRGHYSRYERDRRRHFARGGGGKKHKMGPFEKGVSRP